jgi:hypothetical protein
MEAADSSSPAEVSRVTVRLPPFLAERPAVWFAQAEAQFTLAGISSEKIKFCYMILQLDHRYATEVEDIIPSPPDQDPYTTLRNELVGRLSPSREQRIRQLLMPEELGDRKPSQFLRHLRRLALDVPDDFLRRILSSRLPSNVQAILICQPEGSLDAAARCADSISEVAPKPAIASVGPPSDNTAHLQGIEDLSPRWQHSAPSRTTFATALGIAARAADPHPEVTLLPPSAGTIAASEPGRKSVLSPAPTPSRETNAAVINGGTCLRYNHRPPLHH